MAFIVTPHGVSGFLSGRSFNVSHTHPRYAQVVDALNNPSVKFDDIDRIVNMVEQVKERVQTTNISGIDVDVDSGIVTVDGWEISTTLSKRIVQMLNDGFDISHMLMFLSKLARSPHCIASRLSDWLESNNMPITTTGNFIAFKRVQHNMMSFYDGATSHALNEETSMPRAMCDDDQNHTCSHGLHFCSESYLPSYHSGKGIVLALEIDPTDVVAIPAEYGNRKGRCCRYKVVAVLGDCVQKLAETATPVINAPVVDVNTTLQEAVVVTESYMVGYSTGYPEGKAKSPDTEAHFMLNGEFNRGYADGYKDGRGHKTRLYNTTWSKK